jgi:hypothetical protein
VISLAEFAPLSVEDSSGQFMTIFAFVELLEYTTGPPLESNDKGDWEKAGLRGRGR